MAISPVRAYAKNGGAAFANVGMRRSGMKVLNSFVTELLNEKGLSVEGCRELTFTNPREGWVFFWSTARIEGGDRIRISVDSASEERPIILHDSRSSGTLEAMRYLSEGKHTLEIRGEGRPSLSAVVVRAIPELIYCQHPAASLVTHYGVYDWDFMQKHVLSNVNCIIAYNAILDGHTREIEAWRNEGKRWLLSATVPGDTSDATPMVKQAYDYWHGHPGFQHPLMDGIAVDEFVWGDDDPRFEAWSEAVGRIHEDEKCKDKVFYAWTAGPPMYKGKRNKAFAEYIMTHGGKIAVEIYIPEAPTESEADKTFDWLRDEVGAWNKAIPNASRDMIITLGYFSQPTESLNIDPTVDFKVFLDRQMYRLAGDSTFSGLYGFMYYLATYTDEETVRWGSRLMRHYCIEGKKSMLSPEYGFEYHLKHIKNPDFDDGLTAWDVAPAQEGSITTGHMEGWSWLEGRYPRTSRGDNFLLTKRSAEKPNVFAQEIVNLKPGRLYSMKMFTGDYQDIVNGVSRNPEHQGVSIKIANADLVTDKCFDEVTHNCYSHSLGKFNDQHEAFMVYHWRVFRAKGTTARLTVSDWESETAPGGPIGRELMYNFIEIQPYYSE